MATREEELEIMESNIHQMEDDRDIPIWRRGHAVQMLIDRDHYRAVCAEVENQAEARRRALKVADERSKENCALRQENERLLAALESLTKDPPPTLFREPDTDCEVIQKMRAIAREAIDHGLPKQTPQAFVEAKADRDAGWPRDFEQEVRE